MFQLRQSTRTRAHTLRFDKQTNVHYTLDFDNNEKQMIRNFLMLQAKRTGHGNAWTHESNENANLIRVYLLNYMQAD